MLTRSFHLGFTRAFLAFLRCSADIRRPFSDEWSRASAGGEAATGPEGELISRRTGVAGPT